MVETLLWIEAVFLLVLVVSPTLAFLINIYPQRRVEIMSGIDSKGDRALKLYFECLQPGFRPEKKDVRERFKLFYMSHFGLHHFVYPLVFMAALTAVLLLECNYLLLQSFKQQINILETKQAILIFSILGAYLWVVNDHIQKWWTSDLSPKDLYWASFRFALAVPMGYSVTRVTGKDADIALALAFFLGALPLQTLLTLFRKAAQQALKVDKAAEEAKLEIRELQDVDGPVLERLVNEGILTICQLSYADPILLTIRTNLSYSYIIDIISQAQLKLYTRGNHIQWQKLGIRGGFEVINLDSGLKSKNPTYRSDAEKIIAKLADSTQIPEAAVREIIWEVCNDPYMKFAYRSWTG